MSDVRPPKLWSIYTEKKELLQENSTGILYAIGQDNSRGSLCIHPGLTDEPLRKFWEYLLGLDQTENDNCQYFIGKSITDSRTGKMEMKKSKTGSGCNDSLQNQKGLSTLDAFSRNSHACDGFNSILACEQQLWLSPATFNLLEFVCDFFINNYFIAIGFPENMQS